MPALLKFDGETHCIADYRIGDGGVLIARERDGAQLVLGAGADYRLLDPQTEEPR